MLSYTFLAFVLLFSILKFFIVFISFCRQTIKFPQQNINQSETWIGGFQLSVELYAKFVAVLKKKKIVGIAKLALFCEKTILSRQNSTINWFESVAVYYLKSDSLKTIATDGHFIFYLFSR